MNNSPPTFYMMMGISGSGKSSIADHIVRRENSETVIHASDDIRAELGDVNDQTKNDLVFKILHSRVKQDLSNGKNVIYDATNLNKRRRIAFLRELKNIPCKKVCVCVVKDYYKCICDNSNRERSVPEDVIRRQLMNWQPPHKHEGFDEVQVFVDKDRFYWEYNLFSLFKWLDSIDQDNIHHNSTVGVHCKKCATEIMKKFPEDNVLIFSALLHDIGKPFVKTNVKPNGDIDENSHYYQHQCVSAYQSMLYESNIGADNMLDIANIIYFHMHPYMSWKQSERAKQRDINIIGNEMYHAIERLHEADIAAH